MIVYIDLLSGQEVGSDSHDEEKLYEDSIIAIQSKLVVDVVGDIDIGANASAEEADEALEDEAKKVINIVHAHKLQKFVVSKGEYKTIVRDYFQKLLKKLSEEQPAKVAAFKKNQAHIGKFVQEVILPNFENCDFYMGESADPGTGCLLVPARYVGDAPAPTFYYFVDGVIQTKY